MRSSIADWLIQDHAPLDIGYKLLRGDPQYRSATRLAIMVRCILYVACAAAALLVAYAQVPENEGGSEAVKNETADGRRHRHGHHGHGHHGHNGGYHGNMGYYGQKPPTYNAPVHDRNVCDLDASILLVTDHSRHGYNKAHRVRCADVAAHDEDSCTVCCQHAARRDRTVKNEDIYGILSVIDGFKEREDDSGEEDKHHHHKREKRGAGHGYGDDTEEEEEEEEKTAVERPTWKDEVAKTQFSNVKCMCCAPRRHYAPPPVPMIIQPQPMYQQPMYAAPQPMYAAPQPVYQQAQPQYQPAAAPPAPVYQQAQSQYQQAAAPPAPVPVYQQQPVQQAQPQYQAPTQAPAAPPAAQPKPY